MQTETYCYCSFYLCNSPAAAASPAARPAARLSQTCIVLLAATALAQEIYAML